MVPRPLIEILREALRGLPADVWLYLRDRDVSATSAAILVRDTELDDRGLHVGAAGAGFPVGGLDGQSLEDVASWAGNFEDPPGDELLLESFRYYFRFDAFLPSPGAPDPPPWEETQRRLDREFYDLLGTERAEQRCRRPDCSRGAVSLSIFCRPHHFENIKGRPCPFDD